MAMQPDMSADPAASTPAPDAEAGETAQGGYCIEIHVDAQNKIKGVSVEPEADESDEGEPDSLQPASDIKEALTLCLDVYKSHGKASPGDALGKRLQTAGFSAGYNQD
jgi:hypothetical protein